METELTHGIGHVISSFSVICREREEIEAVVRRRLNGGKGHLIEAGLPAETCGLRGGFQLFQVAGQRYGQGTGEDLRELGA